MKLSRMFLVLGLVVALTSTGRAAGATVVQVIDGDTIVAELDETGSAEVVRLLGVDAPEEYRPDRPNFARAQRARQVLAKHILRKRVRLEFAPERERDRFGRLLAYVHSEAGADLNAMMISRGLGRHFERYTHPRFDAYRTLQEEAEARR